MNNLEYENLMVRTDGLIEEAGAAALGIETEVVARYKQLLALLCDQVARTYALAETPEMEELDKQRAKRTHCVQGRSRPCIVDGSETLCGFLQPCQPAGVNDAERYAERLAVGKERTSCGHSRPAGVYNRTGGGERPL